MTIEFLQGMTLGNSSNVKFTETAYAYCFSAACAPLLPTIAVVIAAVADTKLLLVVLKSQASTAAINFMAAVARAAAASEPGPALVICAAAC